MYMNYCELYKKAYLSQEIAERHQVVLEARQHRQDRVVDDCAVAQDIVRCHNTTLQQNSSFLEDGAGCLDILLPHQSLEVICKTILFMLQCASQLLPKSFMNKICSVVIEQFLNHGKSRIKK